MGETDGSLGVYLHGHYAGAEVAVRSARAQRAAARSEDLADTLARLGREIQEDQNTLREVMGRMSIAPAALKNAAAAVAATLGRWTLRLQSAGDAQSRLIGLESLSLGIEGKASLWRALRAVAADDPRLGDVDFDALIERAESQRDELEHQRLAAARQAHGGPPAPPR